MTQPFGSDRPGRVKKSKSRGGSGDDGENDDQEHEDEFLRSLPRQSLRDVVVDVISSTENQ